LIWGRVKSQALLYLYFTGQEANPTEGRPYRLEEKRALVLDVNFGRDLGAAIAARVVSLGHALAGMQDNFITPYVEVFANKIAPLVTHSKAGWSSEDRSAVLLAFGLAKLLAGQEQVQSAALEQAVFAFRMALKERTRKRVPLDWAATQNNLGGALQTLGERDKNTGKLKEAASAYQEALKVWTRDLAPPKWAGAQNNFGNVLSRVGELENDAGTLKEAISAYQKALKEWTHKRVPLQWAMTQPISAMRSDCSASAGAARKSSKRQSQPIVGR
jgi:tetratricopeptide (TPR) repeat protein